MVISTQLRKKVEILVLRVTFQSDKTISKSMFEFDTAISHVAMAAKKDKGDFS